MRLFCLHVFVLLLCFSLSQSQPTVFDKEKLFQLAQSGKLSGMDPDDIRTLIKQAGLSETEVLKIARERNIDFARYLLQPRSRRDQGGATGQVMQSGMTKAEPESARVPLTPPSTRKPILSVPAFETRVGVKDLRPFGYEVFEYSPSTFEPVVSAPTPAGYIVGPGDELDISVWGQTQLYYELTVGRDGYIVIPDVGKVQVSGQSIDQVHQRLLARMSEIYEGLRRGKPNAKTFLDVSLGKIRTIQVYVLGEAQVPGGYSLSGLSSVFTALYYAGGPTVDGSLRNVRIVHVDAASDTVDLYRYLLFGDKGIDIRLRDGDAVFIPPIARRVAITGEVTRPAIYELRRGETLHDLIAMAGGLRYFAYDKRVHVERIVPFAQRSLYASDILDIDLQFKNAEEMISSPAPLEDGDVLSVFTIGEDRQSLITISGNVRKPGSYELAKDLTVRDLVIKADSLRGDTFLPIATIFRVRPDLKREILSFDLGRAMQRDSSQNILLRKLDSVVVYREEFFKPRQTVTIDGAVRKPGAYQRTEHMTVRDLIVLAEGAVEGANLQNIEVARVDTTSRKYISQIFHVSLSDEYWKSDVRSDLELKDFDNVSLRKKANFSLLQNVVVTGEAMYPGKYAIEYEGERIRNLVHRFGGFKTTAYLPGVRFVRQAGRFGISQPSPEITETSEIDTLALRYNVLKKPRLASEDVPIDVEKLLRDSMSLDNLVLYEGDSLIIPKDPGVVYVEGQVYVPSSVPYKKGESLSYYIKQAGGFKRDADEDNVVVVLPNGMKWEEKGGLLQSSSEILSGSTIITPLKIEAPSTTLMVLREWVTIAASTTTLAFIVWQVTR